MSVELDDLSAPGGDVREPGDFKRRGRHGAPYVLSRTEFKKTRKKGAEPEPKWELYSRPSGYGKLIENSTNLEKWTQRKIIEGLAAQFVGTKSLSGNLLNLLCQLAELDFDDDEFKSKADEIVAQALDAAEAHIAALRGTHVHELLEDSALGRHPILRFKAGELLELDYPAQGAICDAYDACMAANEIEILTTETGCANEEFRAAGKLDAIGRLGKTLRFVLAGGEIREVPAGTVLVVDNKTGKLRRDGAKQDGPPMYWHSYAQQVYLYASSRPYDAAKDAVGEWPWSEWEWPISQEHAIICHIDTLGAMAGATDVCTLVYVDLAVGRAGCELVKAAKAWGKTPTMFSIAQTGDAPAAADDDMQGTEPTPITALLTELVKSMDNPADIETDKNDVDIASPQVEPPAEPDTTADTIEVVPGPTREEFEEEAKRKLAKAFGKVDIEDTATGEVERVTRTQAIAVDKQLIAEARADLQARIDVLKAHSVEAARQLVKILATNGLPTLKQSQSHTAQQLADMARTVNKLAADSGVPFGPPFDPAPPTDAKPLSWMRQMQADRVASIAMADVKRALGRKVAAEGEVLAEDDNAAIADKYKSLARAQKEFVVRWRADAESTGYSVQMGGETGQRTVRRFEITRAMIAASRYAARANDEPFPTQERLLRLGVMAVTGEDFAGNEAVPFGACLGALTADEALIFSVFVDDLASGEFVPSFADGDVILSADVAARYRAA